jgi:hypothetical protein
MAANENGGLKNFEPTIPYRAQTTVLISGEQYLYWQA